MMPLVIRPATEADLPVLSRHLGPCVLPTDPHERLLVAEDSAAARLLACVRAVPALGLVLPRASYHVGCTVHAARELQLFHRQRTLLLGNDHTGASELTELACLDEDLPLAERAAALRLVVQCALLALVRDTTPHAGPVVAELPGVRDAAGQSPFWQGLGRHFYSEDPTQAEARHGRAWRSHVAALLPRHPIYTSFLPASAEAAIAQVHPAARLQREVLEEAGLHYSHHVSIDDGGPVLEGELDTLPAATRSRLMTVGSGPADVGDAHLVLAQSGRAVRVRARAQGNTLGLEPAAQALLGVETGALVWALPLNAG